MLVDAGLNVDAEQLSRRWVSVPEVGVVNSQRHITAGYVKGVGSVGEVAGRVAAISIRR
jgi:hypothetical protein